METNGSFVHFRAQTGTDYCKKPPERDGEIVLQELRNTFAHRQVFPSILPFQEKNMPSRYEAHIIVFFKFAWISQFERMMDIVLQ